MANWAQFGHFHLGVYSLLWQQFRHYGCVLSYFEGTANVDNCIQAVHSLLYIVSEVSFLQFWLMKRFNKIFTTYEGCTHFCEILYIYIYIYIYIVYIYIAIYVCAFNILLMQIIYNIIYVL